MGPHRSAVAGGLVQSLRRRAEGEPGDDLPHHVRQLVRHADGGTPTQAGPGHRVLSEQILQHLSSTDARELVNVTDEQQNCPIAVWRNLPESM